MTIRGMSGREAEHLRSAEFSYSEVAATRNDTMPKGYSHLRRHRKIGTGTERFEGAVQVLFNWDMHRRAGLRVRTPSAHVVQGAVAELQLGVGSLRVNAPVRVVYLVDEPKRKGFAYGTLPGHPESGEESFIVELHDDDDVTVAISAFSRTASLLARAGGPFSRAIQSWVTNRYLGSF